MASYTPTPSYPTQVRLNGLLLAVDSSNWSSIANVQETPSFTGGGKMEHTINLVSGKFTCSGTWNRQFNPQGNGIRVGKAIGLSVILLGGATATDDDAIVDSFELEMNAGVAVRYTISLTCDWNFNDFAGNVVGS